MPALSVAILTEDSAQIPLLQGRVDSTAMARTIYSHAGFPTGPTDPVLRQIQDLRAEIVLVEVNSRDPERAAAAIELLRSTTLELAIFAIGDLSQPLAIVSAMRAGACEYLDRDSSSASLLEAFTRFTATRHRRRDGIGRARVFTFVNAKGGSGSTTLAVNTALTLQQEHRGVALVDFAPLGHASLHLNARPSFGVADALQNLHRLDASLLEGLMTPCAEGLHLLAGPPQPSVVTPTPAELARLFDLLVSCYRYVVVDCSTRVDATTRLLSDLSHKVMVVAQTDVVALWSAGRIQAFLTDGAQTGKVGLVLNRYKKIPGFSDEDAEKATSCKLLWKVPNHYQSIAPAIDRGQPVALQENLEVTRSLHMLAAKLLQIDGNPPEPSGHGGTKEKSPGRLLISAFRTGN
jgi:pilus assembly protein CpaE